MYTRFYFENMNVNCVSNIFVGVIDKSVGVLISLWLFLFAAQAKEFFLDGLKKLEQRSLKCVELRGEYVEQTNLFQSRSLLFS
jgi:hypothetical protein